MEDTIILNGIEEIGSLFHNRLMFKLGLRSILAKDYPVSYQPIKIFDFEGNSRKHILKPVEANLEGSAETNEVKKKWMKTVSDGAIKALYRANLGDFNLDPEQVFEVPSEKDIFLESIFENEAAIIPDTSSLMDGFVSRLIESENYNKLKFNVYLSPTVIKELQKHAMVRQEQLEKANLKEKDKEEAIVNFAEKKRKARIALRILSELVEYRNTKELSIKLIEIKRQEGDVDDWNILQEAKFLQVDMPKFFITNDLIQNTIANLMGLKTKYMSPPHLFSKIHKINLKNNKEVGKALYELAIQFGEIIIETKSEDIQFILQSDWPNKMSPSWVNKILFTQIKYNDNTHRGDIIKIINRKRISNEKIEDFDPRISFPEIISSFITSFTFCTVFIKFTSQTS